MLWQVPKIVEVIKEVQVEVFVDKIVEVPVIVEVIKEVERLVREVVIREVPVEVIVTKEVAVEKIVYKIEQVNLTPSLTLTLTSAPT